MSDTITSSGRLAYVADALKTPNDYNVQHNLLGWSLSFCDSDFSTLINQGEALAIIKLQKKDMPHWVDPRDKAYIGKWLREFAKHCTLGREMKRKMRECVEGRHHDSYETYADLKRWVSLRANDYGRALYNECHNKL